MLLGTRFPVTFRTVAALRAVYMQFPHVPGHSDPAHCSRTAHPAARSRMRSALAHGQSDRSLTAPSRLYSNSTLRVCTCVATTPKAEKGGPAFVQSRHSTAHAPHSAHRSGEGACTACLHRITVYAYLTIYTYFPLTIAYSYSSDRTLLLAYISFRTLFFTSCFVPIEISSLV